MKEIDLIKRLWGKRVEKALKKMETDMKQTPVKVSVIQEALLLKIWAESVGSVQSKLAQHRSINSIIFDSESAKKANPFYPALEKARELQDSNLCGQSPSDFESDSLTTRTNSPEEVTKF